MATTFRLVAWWPGGPRAYCGGTWASTLRYRESNGLWYWIGCINFWITWVFTAKSVEGPWTNSANFGRGNCFYENGLHIDDDDTMYVVYGVDRSTFLSSVQMSSAW